MRVPGRPVYIDGRAEPVFGFFHDAGETDTAVVICPPFGWDDVCSYRGRREWAEQLAAAGHSTLRIDLPGTGDSAGSPRDQARLAAWTAAVDDASRWLRAQTGCTRLVAIGIGLGGLLACLATSAGAPIDDLVLWSVPARGRSLLRELRVFASLKAAEFPDPEAEPPPPLPDGYLEVAGFLMTAETTEALGAVDLTGHPLADPAARRVLLLERDGVPVDARLRDHFAHAGAAVTVGPGHGYGAMMTNPQEAESPLEVFEQVAAWIADGPPAAGAVSDLAAVAPPGERDELELTVSGVRIRERPVTVDQPFGKLFGILSEPIAAPPAKLALVLVNGGAVRRVGPNRLWVEIARRWAARGVPTLRLDIEGLGDSDGDGRPYVDTAKLYAPELSEQVRAAIDELEARGVATRFVVGGLCAGASWAFHVLLRDARVSAALMLNLFAFFWDDALPTVREVRRVRKLLRLHTWRRVFRGEASLRQIAVILRWLVMTPVELPGRIARRRRHADQLDDAFDELREAGKRAVLILGRGEPIYDQLSREGRLERLASWPNVELHQVPGRDHTFRAVVLQQHVQAVIDDSIVGELEREWGGEVSGPPRPALEGVR